MQTAEKYYPWGRYHDIKTGRFLTTHWCIRCRRKKLPHHSRGLCRSCYHGYYVERWRARRKHALEEGLPWPQPDKRRKDRKARRRHLPL